MKRFFRVQSPARLISLGFAAAILLGSALLMLPCSVRDGAELKYIDALYTSTSAVCVTGLIAVDAGDTFTPFGQVILALLIQIGGLGITSIGAGIMLAMGKKLDLKSRRLIQEASNLDSNRGAVRFIRSVLRTTLIFGELVPKRIAMKKSEALALGVSGVVSGISVLFKPIVWLLSISTNAVLRLLGIDPKACDITFSGTLIDGLACHMEGSALIFSLMDSDATATLRTDGTLALDMLGMMLMYFVPANL